MPSDLTEKKIMKAQFDANRRLRDDMDKIRVKARDAIVWAESKGYKPNQTLIDIEKIAQAALDDLDVRGARLDSLRKGDIPRGQSRL